MLEYITQMPAEDATQERKHAIPFNTLKLFEQNHSEINDVFFAEKRPKLRLDKILGASGIQHYTDSPATIEAPDSDRDDDTITTDVDDTTLQPTDESKKEDEEVKESPNPESSHPEANPESTTPESLLPDQYLTPSED
jgi:hypothetical protein